MYIQIFESEVKVKSLSRIQLFATLWPVAYHAPPSMGFSMARVLEWPFRFIQINLLNHVFCNENID